MNKFNLIIAILLFGQCALAQAPEKMTYQAVIRDNTNTLVINHAIGMKISILQGSTTGNSVYEEIHTPTTNANGLASLEIGTGTVQTGKFNSIDWAKGPYFIKTETDPSGGTNYNITSVSQLLSVPYALYSERSRHSDTALVATSVKGGSSSVSFPKGQSVTIAVTNFWKEIDLSSFVGKNRAMLEMRLINLEHWTSVVANFRPKGDTLEYSNSFSNSTANVGSNGSAIFTAITDENGILEYKGILNVVVGVRLEIIMILK